MASIIYACIIIIAIILLALKREWLLYYFVFLYPILPEYMAISFSDALPLFTASRMLLLILICSFVLRKKIRITKIKNKYFRRALLFYVICEGMVCVAHISDIDSIKTYSSVILENFLFIIVLYNIIDTKKKFERCMTAIMLQTGFVFLMGILEPITKTNLSMIFLNTNARTDMLMSVYERYDSIRAVFTFGHAIALGVYCVSVLPLIMLKISSTKKMKYYILFELGLGCLLMTMSRGVVVVFAFIFISYCLKMNKKEKQIYYKIIAVTFLFAGIIILLVPEIFEVAKKTVLASLNAFGADFNIDTGGNENALLSRFSQFTILPQVLCKYPLFGGGTGYITKNIVYVYLKNKSFRAVSIDMEYLSMLINRGIVGLLGGGVLYISVLRMSWNGMKVRQDSISKAFFFAFLGIFLSYFTVAQLTTGNILWMLIGLYLCYDKLYLREDGIMYK